MNKITLKLIGWTSLVFSLLLLWTYDVFSHLATPAWIAYAALGLAAVFGILAGKFGFFSTWKKSGLVFASALVAGSLLTLLVHRLQTGPGDLAYYTNPVGNCSPGLRVLPFMGKWEDQFSQSILTQFPPSTQYLSWTAEDFCRTMKLERTLKKEASAAKLCRTTGTKDTFACFLDVLGQISEQVPLTTTGYIMMDGLGVALIIKDKKTLSKTHTLKEEETIPYTLETLKLAITAVKLSRSHPLRMPTFTTNVDPISTLSTEKRQEFHNAFLKLNNSESDFEKYLAQQTPENSNEFQLYAIEQTQVDFETKSFHMIEEIIKTLESKIHPRTPASAKIPEQFQTELEALKQEYKALQAESKSQS